MDRRFLVWLMLTTVFFFLYISMQKPPQPKQPAEAAKVEENQDAQANPLLRAAPQADPAPGDAANGELEQPIAQTSVEKVVTLGSMNAAKKFNLLLTLSSRGASVERAELVGQRSEGKFKYIALEHEGGYLGYLGLAEQADGLRVRVVPDGSPAAMARGSDGSTGIQVGDLITEVLGKPLNKLVDYEKWLEKTKPKQTVDLKVVRQGQTIDFQVTLSQAPLDLLRSHPRSIEQIVGNQEINGLRTTIAAINNTKIPIGNVSLPALEPIFERNWQVQQIDVPGGEGVEFRLSLDDMLSGTEAAKLDLVKRYRLLPAASELEGYTLDLETEVVNRNEQTVAIGIRQEGPTGLTLEGWWYSVKIGQAWFTSAGCRDVALSSNNGIHTLKTTAEIFKHAKNNPSQPHTVLFSAGEPVESRTLQYIGSDAQYFNASLLPHPESPQSMADLAQAGARIVGDPTKVNQYQIQASNVAFWFDTTAKEIPSGQSLVQRYNLFLGPKDSNLLANYGLERTIEYGWFPWVAKPLGAILHLFYAIVRNYGLAIVLLTLCVRMALFPLGRQAAITSQRMQELQPEIKKINEKYPDMEKRARAMQELYAKHNFRPLAGCLPMFLQLPIFIGLYRCLSVDVSLRQEPLIPGLSWCANLAGPDQLYNWSGWMMEYLSGRGTGWLGPFLNILPLVTVALFLVQQYITIPKATDPQTQMTQTMMKWMTAFMAVMFFKVPAGLCVYFITSSLWSLIERQLVKRTIPASSSNTDINQNVPSKPKPSERGFKDSSSSSPTAFDKIKAMLDKPAVRSGTQRGTKKRKGNR